MAECETTFGMGLFTEQAFHILLYYFHKGGGKHTSCTLFISIGTDEIIFPGICLRQLLNVFDELYNSLKRIYFLAIFNIKLTKKSGDKIIVRKKNIFWDTGVARQAMTERPTIKNIRGKKGAPMHYKYTYSCNIDKPLNGQHKKTQRISKKVNFWTFELLQLPLVFLLKIFDCSHRLREKIRKPARTTIKKILPKTENWN